MSYVKKVLEKAGKFEVEDMVKYAEEQAARFDVPKAYIDLHKFGKEMLEYEIGLDMGARAMFGGKKDIFQMVKVGRVVSMSAAVGMRQLAKTLIHDMGYLVIKPLKNTCQREIKRHDKYTMIGFYYRSVLRYLRATGQR